ncbi:GNAT family N-acetyltransferase [uncultured Friedmanniella sp.]|uniref:GNAT family N-acetyltransferase n=1 Tax=uncultured Friedmanniella sp. TaxID=335381 RepID=UPI0035CBD22C
MTTTPGPLADSVRLAWPAEAAAVADLQRRVWSSELSAEVAATVLGGVSAEEMTQAWGQAISRPPKARYRVLVAIADARVVGFATTVPGQDPDADEAADGEVQEFAVDPPARHRGHGSRLLNACADTLRADGFRHARWWVGEDDQALRGFLGAAGWVPDGSSREIGTDDEAVRLTQVRLHTDLADG